MFKFITFSVTHPEQLRKACGDKSQALNVFTLPTMPSRKFGLGGLSENLRNRVGSARSEVPGSNPGSSPGQASAEGTVKHSCLGGDWMSLVTLSGDLSYRLNNSSPDRGCLRNLGPRPSRVAPWSHAACHLHDGPTLLPFPTSTPCNSSASLGLSMGAPHVQGPCSPGQL